MLSFRPMEVPDLLQHQVSILRLPPLPFHCYFYTRLKYAHGSHWLYHIQAFGKLGWLWAVFWQSFPWLKAHHEMLAGASPGNLASLQLFSQSVSGLALSTLHIFLHLYPSVSTSIVQEEPDTTVFLTLLLHLRWFQILAKKLGL